MEGIVQPYSHVPPSLLIGEASGFRDDPKMCEDEASNFYPEAVEPFCS